MLCRRIAPIWLAVLVAACSAQEQPRGLATDSLRTELPPAELPTYAKGDSYTFDNPRETWTVVAIANAQVTWESSLGGIQSTMFDPLLPPISWHKPNDSGGKRRIVEWSGSLFPLKAGNKLTYKSAVEVDGERGHALFVWNCYAGNPRRVSVPAGDFAAIPVYCRRSDGRTLLSYYAPALNGTISSTTGKSGGDETVRNLIAFSVGPGPRVLAQRAESLPGGWSALAVAQWGRNGVTVPRLKPELIAATNPPLTFASPATTTPPIPDKRVSSDTVRSAPREAPKKELNAGPRRTAALEMPAVRVPPPAAVPAPKKKALPAQLAKKPSRGAGYGAHLGSFGSPETADRAWKQYGDKHKLLRAGAKRLVYPIDLGEPKGVFYRLVAKPNSSKAESRQLCRKIKQEGGYCRVISIAR